MKNDHYKKVKTRGRCSYWGASNWLMRSYDRSRTIWNKSSLHKVVFDLCLGVDWIFVQIHHRFICPNSHPLSIPIQKQQIHRYNQMIALTMNIDSIPCSWKLFSLLLEFLSLSLILYTLRHKPNKAKKCSYKSACIFHLLDIMCMRKLWMLSCAVQYAMLSSAYMYFYVHVWV